MDGFIREGAAARDDSDDPLLMNKTRHDADLRFIDRDDAWAIWSDQSDITSKESPLHLHHIVDGYPFGNADYKPDTGICRFEDRIGAERRRYEDERGVALGLLDRISHRVEHRNAFDFLTGFARRDACDHLRPIGLALG